MAKLGDICEIQSGGTPARSKCDYWEGGTIPWVKISDIRGKYLENTEEFITDEGLKNSSAKILPKGTILYTIFATLGETCILNIDAATNQAIAGITIKNDIVYREYLYYYLSSLKSEVNRMGRGVAQNNINMSILRNFSIQLPSLDEQRKIAAVLDKVSGLIEKRRQQLDKLDELIKSRFLEMFGEPIANQMKWPVKTLRELSEVITNGNTPKGGAENYVEQGIQFIRSQNVWRDRLDMSDVVYIDQETHESMKKSSVHHNDILITKTGRINTENSSLGRAALYTGEDDTANINGHVYLIRLKENINPEYVLTILTGEAYRDYIRKVCVGGIDKRQINLEHVERFPIILPPEDMVDRFVSFKQEIDKSKSAIQKSLEKLETLKKSLLQEYFG